MIIEGEFYRLTPISEHSSKYDLELLYEIKGKNPRSEFKVAGYGMPFNSILKSIIRYALYRKFKDQSVSLQEYIKAYIEESKALRNELFKHNL